MGYTGKQVIHPDQVPVVQKAFSPSPTQTKWASELIEAFHHHQQTGKVSCVIYYTFCIETCAHMHTQQFIF